ANYGRVTLLDHAIIDRLYGRSRDIDNDIARIELGRHVLDAGIVQIELLQPGSGRYVQRVPSCFIHLSIDHQAVTRLEGTDTAIGCLIEEIVDIGHEHHIAGRDQATLERDDRSTRFAD